MEGTYIHNPETRRLVEMFNKYTVQDYANTHNEQMVSYNEADIQRIIETHRGIISPGAIYKWPDSKGDKVHVTGFGLAEFGGELWFLAAFNSKKLGRPKIEKLNPETVLKMLEWGEVEYLGNIMNPEFRRNFDYERLSLAVMGFASLVMTTRMQRNVPIDEVIDKIENGEMTMDELLQKCGDVVGPDMTSAPDFSL